MSIGPIDPFQNILAVYPTRLVVADGGLSSYEFDGTPVWSAALTGQVNFVAPAGGGSVICAECAVEGNRSWFVLDEDGAITNQGEIPEKHPDAFDGNEIKGVAHGNDGPYIHWVDNSNFTGDNSQDEKLTTPFGTFGVGTTWFSGLRFQVGASNGVGYCTAQIPFGNNAWATVTASGVTYSGRPNAAHYAVINTPAGPVACGTEGSPAVGFITGAIEVGGLGEVVQEAAFDDGKFFFIVTNGSAHSLAAFDLSGNLLWQNSIGSGSFVDVYLTANAGHVFAAIDGAGQIEHFDTDGNALSPLAIAPGHMTISGQTGGMN